MLPLPRRVYQLFDIRANRRGSARLSTVLAPFTLALAIGVIGSGAAAAPRAIEPAGDGPSMASVPMVEIGNETRPVLERARRRVLKINERVRLPESRLEVPVELPDDLAPGTRVKVEAHGSVRDPELDKKDVAALRYADRVRVDAPQLLVEAGGAPQKLVFDLPPEVVGHRGLLTAVARELPPEASVSSEVGPWAVGEGDRLEFGFAVEPAGWDDEFPPLRFRVLGRPEGGEEVVLFERRIDPARDERDRRWHDGSVSVDALAGKKARFRFEGEALAETDGVGVSRSFPVFANPRLRSSGPTDGRRPNLVLISLDTLRAKSVGAYGHRHPTTPSLDRRLVGEGALVRDAVVPVPFTPPSHMTMLTGLEPCVHGVKNRDGILAPEDLLLAEMLRAAGYDTAAFTENAYVVSGAGFARGFDTYVEQRASAEAAPGFAVETFRAAEAWLAREAHQPFFLFLHTYQVHQPYTPPRGYRHLFGGFPKSDERPQHWKDDEQAYDQEIRYTDDLLGAFLDVLEARGLADDTIVVVTSDHGEEFGHFKWGGHGFSLRDGAILVPMVVRAPGQIEPGTVLETQVGLVDLVPTVLDLLGIPLPRPVQGLSFAPQLRGEQGPGEFAKRPLVSRTTGFDISSVRTPKTKYIHHGKPKESEVLFLLKQDPEETRSYADEQPKLVERSRRALEQHERRCREYREAHPVTAGKDALFEQRPDWLINRNEIERKLRSLGYVE